MKHAALDCGINYFDVAPAYGATRAETVLGKALRDIPRDRYFLSTKVGKHTTPGGYGRDTLDYSRGRIRGSLLESSVRLGTEHFDIIHLHDIEYLGRRHTEWALGEGLDSLRELKREGRIGAIGVGIYPLDLWRRILSDYDVDAGLIHNHYCLNDTGLLGLLPTARLKGIGIINGSPFGSGLLTDRGPAAWHPAGPDDRAVFREAAEFCHREGSSIGKVALQFSSQHPDIPTTLFSTSNPESVQRNVQWHSEPFDEALVSGVRGVLRPVLDKQWEY
jgi:aryl-alcohol dehydrogenase-like predicted oxidoreductase